MNGGKIRCCSSAMGECSSDTAGIDPFSVRYGGKGRFERECVSL